MKKGSKRGFLAPFWGFWGYPEKGLKRALLGLLGTLWRDSEGVRRGSDRRLEEVERGLLRKKRVERVERADRGTL